MGIASTGVVLLVLACRFWMQLLWPVVAKHVMLKLLKSIKKSIGLLKPPTNRDKSSLYGML